MDRFSARLAAALIEDRHREAAGIRRAAALRASAAPGHTTWLAPFRHLTWLARERAGRLLRGGGRSMALHQEGHR